MDKKDTNRTAIAVKASTKESNPKDSIGITKPPLSTLSGPVLYECGLGMLEGAMKYGRHNYREYGVRGSVYFDATMRHLWSWWEGEDVDPASNLSHITKAITSLMTLRDSMIKGNWTDDRPPISIPDFVAHYSGHVGELIEKYPDPVAPYTEKDIK